MDAIHLAFLGVPHVRRDENSIVLTRAKGIALLLYLAVTRVAQPRERVLDLLWPESSPQAARKNMRNTLWAISEALGHDVLEQGGNAIRLVATVQVDIHALEDGLLLLPSSSVAQLETAASHYHGPLADGLVVHEAPEFELWLATERERLATLYLRLIERIIALHQAAGDWQAVIVYAQQALVADPLREPMHVALIEAQVRLGLRAQAMQHYAALASMLRRELDVAPLPETTARYEVLLADVPQRAAMQPAPSLRFVEPVAPFIGRTTELAALDAERARVAQGARVVLITGDLGLGKSQLWRTWADTRANGTTVLATHVLETSEPVPFGPLLALFRQPGPARTLLEPPSALAPIWLAELARLLPEITTAWPSLPAPLALSPAEERARLFQALTEAIRLLVQPSLVLVIDDLHWADPSTLDWLVYLIDHLRDVPLLLIGTYRPQDASERLMVTAAGWQRQGRLRAIALAQLAPDEAHALIAALGGPNDPNLADHWVHQSGGNPYFLLELRRARANDPPGDLVALVRARVQAIMPSAAMQVLQVAAVLGDNAEFAAINAASGRSEEETLDALDALDAAAVLRVNAGTYHFVHPLVATVIRQDLSAARRAFLHRRAALALERAYAPTPERFAEQLLDHYATAGDLGRAAYYAEHAARQAVAVGAFVEALAYARRATQYETTPQRQLLLGEALVTSGSAREAQVQLEAALGSFEQADDAVGATRAIILLAQIEIGKSQPAAARRWLARAPIVQAQVANPTLGAHVHLLAASIDRQSQDYAAASLELDRAAQLVQTHQLSVLAAQIAFERGNLLANRGDLRAALDAFGASLRYARNGVLPLYEAMASNNLAYHTLLVGDLDDAQVHINEAAQLTTQYALGLLWQYVYSTTGEIALAQGQLDAAGEAFAHAYAAAREWDNRVHMANVRVNQALVARARNDNAQARVFITEAHALFGNAVDPFVRDKIAQVSAKLA